MSAVVRDTPERVWTWWTDYGATGERYRIGHGFAWTDREILARQGNIVDMRESMLGIPVLRHRVELHPLRRALRETSDAFEAWWSFEPHPDGTRVRRMVEVRGRAARLAPRRLTAWTAQKDLDHHAAEYEREANRSASP